MNTTWFLILIIILFFGWKLLLYRWRQVQNARARGLWPKKGETPTLQHVKRLAEAGEKYLAMRLYRQMNPDKSLAEAKTIVEKMGK
jgi:hypothetical protein